jgi:hypothetical protein
MYVLHCTMQCCAHHVHAEIGRVCVCVWLGVRGTDSVIREYVRSCVLSDECLGVALCVVFCGVFVFASV